MSGVATVRTQASLASPQSVLNHLQLARTLCCTVPLQQHPSCVTSDRINSFWCTTSLRVYFLLSFQTTASLLLSSPLFSNCLHTWVSHTPGTAQSHPCLPPCRQTIHARRYPFIPDFSVSNEPCATEPQCFQHYVFPPGTFQGRSGSPSALLAFPPLCLCELQTASTPPELKAQAF